MTDFAKMKISFALALLATLFALHPFLDRFDDLGFVYLGLHLEVFHAYALIATLLGACVYFYAVSLLSERAHTWCERTGNHAYALAILIPPIFGGLFASSRLADRLAMSHLAWAAPTVAISLGLGWLSLAHLAAWSIRARLSERDRESKIAQLAQQESEALDRAREMFECKHFDIAVIEAHRGLEARLRQALLSRRYSRRLDSAQAVIELAARAGLLSESTKALVREIGGHLSVALSTEPLPKECAEASLSSVRHILSVTPVRKPTKTLRDVPHDQDPQSVDPGRPTSSTGASSAKAA